MRRTFRLLAAFSVTLTWAAAAQAQSISVKVDQAMRVSLGGVARDVVIGNPAVADVTVLDRRTLVVLGKGPGVTNLVVVDARGRTLIDREIVVGGGDEGRVSYFRGGGVQTYACSPRCERIGSVDQPATTTALPPAPGSAGPQ